MRSYRLGVVTAILLCLLCADDATAGRDVRGVVTDALGHPREYVNFGPDYNHLNFDSPSDVDGKFVLKNVPARKTFWVASATGKRGLFGIPPDATTVEVKLQYGNSSVTGRLIDSQKRGVKAATVNFYLKLGDDEFFIDDAKTDAGGYFNTWLTSGDGLTLIARVMVGEGVVAVFDPVALHDNQFGIDLPDLTVPDKVVGQTGLAETRRVIGGVVQDEQGKPIAGAKLDIQWSLEGHNGGRLWTQTDADGRWSRRVPLSVTAVELKLFEDHHVSTIFDRSAPTPTMENLMAGSAVSVMKRGHLVRGTVRDEAGKPVDDALVLAASTGANGGTLEPDEDVATHSAADGTFQIDGIPPGEREFTVYGRNLAPSIVKVDVRADLPPLDVTLKSGDEMHGIVVDTSGKPIGDAEISVYTWKAEGGGWHVVPRNPKANADGRFTLAHLPTGTFMLRIWKKGYNSLSADDVRVQAEPQKFTLSKPATLAGKVVDDASGAPVKSFTLIPGWHDEKSGPLFTDDVIPVTSANGSFSKRLRWGSQTTQPVRVIADGYLVKDTAVDTSDGAPASEIRLAKGEPYTGKILRPDGKPIPDAQVAWVGPGRQAFVNDGLIKDEYTYRADIVVRCDGQGEFKLPRTLQKGHIFITSFDGHALIARDDFHNGQAITVTPWATIHGTVHGGGQSPGGKYVTVYPTDRPRFDDSSPVNWQLYASTNPDGTFTIGHVPAMPLRISRNEVGVRSHEQTINPKPGETIDVQLGAGGQTVRGRIAAPADLPTDQFNTAYGLGKHYTAVYARRAGAPAAPGVDDVGYAADLRPDGSFSIEGVPPAKYELIVKLHAPPMPQSCGISVARASAKVPFELADQPLELGSIALQAHPLPAAGQPAPPLEGKTLDAKPASLAQLKGKIVLLDFWASWCAPCKAQTPHVKEVFDKYSKGGKLAVLGVNLDYKTEDAVRYAAQEKLPWPSIAFAGWGETNPALQAYGVSSIPSFWLIDQGGNVIAREIPPAELDAAVAGALARHE